MKYSSGKISGSLGGVKVGDAFPVRVMGVINLTKNSFYSASVKQGIKLDDAALKMQQSGADFIDIGARSTAPYRRYDVTQETETRLIRESVRRLYAKLDIPISVDTTRIGPATAGISEGALVVNDVYGLSQREGVELARIVSKSDRSLILTSHECRRSQGAPMERVMDALEKSCRMAKVEGVDLRKTAIDPGIGFFSDEHFSNVEWNSLVLSNLKDLRKFCLPICAGVSRKKFIGTIGGGIPAEERLSGSLAATAIAVYNGCHIIRTHDVGETVKAIRVAEQIRTRQKRLIQNGE